MSDNKNSKDYIDLDQTIEFSKEDLRKLRRPNRQPQDSDYFDRQTSASSYDEIEELENFATGQDSTINDGQNDYLFDGKAEAKEASVRVEKKYNFESNDQENPFIYKPQSDKYRAELEYEQTLREEELRYKREKYKNRFNDMYEPVYDEDLIQSDVHFNQFDEDQEEEEFASRQSKSTFSFSTFLSSLKEKFTRTRGKLHDRFNEDDENNYQYDDYDEVEDDLDTENNLFQAEISDQDEFTAFEQLLEEDQSKDLLKAQGKKFEETSSIDVEAIIESIESQPDLKEAELEVYSEELSVLSEQVEDPIITDQLIDDGILAEEVIQHEASKESDQDQNSFLKGTMWLSAGNIISRILGALYVIPWAMWFGDDYLNANGLFSIGYRSYALFLAISTAGFPSAIAKQLAYFHAKKEYKIADKLFKTSIMIMLAMGIVTSLIFYFIAPAIAYQSSTDNPQAAIIVIRSLAPALLILPVMSMLRGYFQGFNDMVPTAISQIIEQVARIIYMLVATYAIMQLMSGNVTLAVAHSTFAAFIGGLLSLVYLGFVFFRRYPAIKRLIDVSENEVDLNIKQSIVVLLKDSIPFILLGSGIIIAQNIDQFTFKQILVNTSLLLESEISQLFGVMSLDVDKLIMIIISVAVGMSLSSIPLISSLFAHKERRKTANLIENIIVLFLLIMLPASLGMASISNNMYQLFYANGHEQGPALLVTASYLSIVLGAYTVVSTILQSMNYRRLAIKHLGIGLLVKLILQYPLVALFQAHGALIATLIAFLVTTVLMLLKIHQLVKIDFKKIIPNILIIVIATLLMAISASFWNATLDNMFGLVGRFATFGKILYIVLVSGLTYFGILALFGKLDLLFGNKYANLQEKLRMF